MGPGRPGGYPLPWIPSSHEIEKSGLPERCIRVMTVLAYWQPKAVAKKPGSSGRWVVRSRVELMRETGLSGRTLDRAIRDLKQHRIVTIERARFAGAKVHLWMRFAGPNEWRNWWRNWWRNTRQVGGETGDPQVAKPHTLTIPKEQSSSSKEQITALCAEKTCGEEIEMKTFGGKTQEIIANLKQAQEKHASDEEVDAQVERVCANPTVSRLEKLWELAWINAGHGFCQKVSGKEQGNLKSLAADLGAETTAALIVCTLRDWKQFASWAAQESGFAGKYPARPAIWFLHTHRALALAWVSQTSKAPENGSSAASATISADDELWGKIL